MKKQLHPCPSTQYCSVWNRGVTILESFISFMYQTESLMCSKRYDCWSLWVPLLCMCARTLHGYDFLGQLSHLNRYTQTVSRSSIFFIILIWFDICHIVHYIYMYVCMYMLTHPPGPTCFFYFIDWISLQGQSSHILYIYTYYIYTYYIYIHGQSLVISFGLSSAGRFSGREDALRRWQGWAAAGRQGARVEETTD